MGTTEQAFDFGEAIRRLKNKAKVTREGWNGREMYLFLVTPLPASIEEYAGLSLPQEHGEAWDLPQRPVICMKDAQGHVVIGWVASQTDMLAEDWREVIPSYRFAFGGVTYEIPMCGRTLIQTPLGDLLSVDRWDYEARTATVYQSSGRTAIDPKTYVQAKPV